MDDLENCDWQEFAQQPDANPQEPVRGDDDPGGDPTDPVHRPGHHERGVRPGEGPGVLRQTRHRQHGKSPLICIIIILPALKCERKSAQAQKRQQVISRRIGCRAHTHSLKLSIFDP